MKRYLYILLATLTAGSLSCKKSFLDENPSSFLTTGSAFKTEADFNASVNNLYGLVRSHYYTVNDFNPFWYMYRTDAYYDATASAANLPGEIAASATAITNFAWAPHYKIIEEANTIIHRLPTSSLNDNQKKLFEAKARFFRGFAYRALGYLYGGVPINLDEIEKIKTDFTRATREEVYAQAEEDLKFAAANLPDIAGVKDGEISNVAAYHFLAELFNTEKKYQDAVNAATAVINNPAMKLMQARFGTRRTVTPGDVYWDLFQRGNQNRKSAGNTEAIWIIQIETDVPGGGGSTTGGSQFGVYAAERVHAPLVRDLKSMVGTSQISLFNWPMGDYSGGRGVGFLAPSYWFSDTVWSSDVLNKDIRNANNNFVRDFVSNNPASPFYGQTISTKNPPPGLIGVNGNIQKGKWDRAFYPYQSKCSQAYDYPTALYANPNSTDPVQKYALKSGAGGTYIDQYMSRLAETYLLRAEAYVGLGQTAPAANDINKVRTRAGADTSLTASIVSLDYILDERMRELGIEEKRMLTLMRLGKWVERTRKCNPFYGVQMKDNYNLWPIPVTEIEKNNNAVLEQNPGY